MANVFDTAAYILEKQGCMSTMKLQKLCYYSQAWSLVWDDPLFDEDFQAWANGPVCPPLFFENRGKYQVCSGEVHGDSHNLSVDQKDTIDKVLAHYAPHSAQWLSQLTHMERPWQQARIGVPDGAPSDNIISKASMAEYYESL